MVIIFNADSSVCYIGSKCLLQMSVVEEERAWVDRSQFANPSRPSRIQVSGFAPDQVMV